MKKIMKGGQYNEVRFIHIRLSKESSGTLF